MKEYKLVYLNKGVKFSREKDLEQAEEMILSDELLKRKEEILAKA